MRADKERAVLGLEVWLPVATYESHSCKVLLKLLSVNEEIFLESRCLHMKTPDKT